MELQLNADQQMLQESVQRFLHKSIPLDLLHSRTDDGARAEPALQQALHELGLAGLLVPETHAGSGLGFVDAAVVAESIGAAAAPVAFTGTVMAVTALRSLGDGAPKERWLGAIASGEARLAVCFPSSRSGQTGEASAEVAAGRLSGLTQGVLDVAGASHLLVFLAGGRGVLVDVRAQGVRVTARATLDRTRPLFDIEFDRAAFEPLADDSHRAIEAALDAGRLMLAADTLGAAQAMLDRAVAYAKERVQFGRVIGSFQGVKYLCADMITMLAPCRAMVWQTAHEMESGSSEARLMAYHVKAHLGDVGREVSRMATEVHGGIGFTDVLGLHFWLKRIAFNRQVLGSAELCRQQAAQLQGWIAA